MSSIDEAERFSHIRAFVHQAGWDGAIILPMNPDSSTNHFLRVQKDGQTAIVMDARAPLNDTKRFVFIRDKFARIGLSVPEIYACDHDQSLVMMEDFGDERVFEMVINNTADIDRIYGLAVDALVQMAKADPAVALEGSVAYGDEYWGRRTEMFLTHYNAHFLGGGISPKAQQEYRQSFKMALASAQHFDPVLLHGDYGSQNLYDKADRPGFKAVCMIDLQDMTPAPGNMMGSPAFGPVQLLQDVRVTLPPHLEAAMIQRFVGGAGIKDRNAFAEEYAIIGAAQAAKCLGLFAKLGCVEGRAEYFPFIAKCWDNLETNMKHPALREMRDWFDTYVPVDRRHGVSVSANFNVLPTAQAAFKGP